MTKKPLEGLKALPENWRFDVSSGISTALVALPLGLGIALAAGLPATAGIFAAIIGGLLGSIYSGTHVGIKGPAAALVPVILFAIVDFGGDLKTAFPIILAAFFISGLAQVLMGFLKLGIIADFFPASVVKGILAAVGLIILAKQIGPGLGVELIHNSNLDILLNTGQYLLMMNPYIAVITFTGIFLLVFIPRLRNKFINIVPPAMWVILVSFIFTYFIDFDTTRTIVVFGNTFHMGPNNLIDLPNDLLADITHPVFNQLQSLTFWKYVLTITLVSTIENLASTKAIEKLDPCKRKSKINRDLISSGFCTMISSLVGGLPVITVISRTSININHGARTKWSNFFHGLICLIVILLFGAFFERVPQAALSAILIYTGYKLASPKVFLDSYRVGIEQVVILSITIIATLATTIPAGIVIGIISTLIIHDIRSGLSSKLFLKYLIKPQIKVIKEERSRYVVKLKGIANFFNILRIQSVLNKLPKESNIILEFSNTRLVDYTVMEFLHDYMLEYNQNNGNLEVIGLDTHETSSSHPYSLHVHVPNKGKKLTKRQMSFELLAHENGWRFNSGIEWDTDECKAFHFFDTRPIEYRKNTIYGGFNELNVNWIIGDITFDEGALLATEVYRSTMQIIDLPFTIPSFSLEKEYLMDRILELAGSEDIDFSDHKKFSKNFILQSDNEEQVHEFFKQELLDFFVKHTFYRMESNGNSILMFHNFRLASIDGVKKMIEYSHELTTILSTIAKTCKLTKLKAEV